MFLRARRFPRLVLRFAFPALAAVAGLAACSNDDDDGTCGVDCDGGAADGNSRDGGASGDGAAGAGPDATVGSGNGADAALDANAAADASNDAGADATVDGSAAGEGGTDASSDSGANSGLDAGVDGGMYDGGSYDGGDAGVIFASYAVGSAATHECGIAADASLWCWGNNDSGQLGDGTTTNRDVPVFVGGGWTSVAVGAHHTCAIETDGSLWCWGANDARQLGDGTKTTRPLPTRVGTSTWASVALGESHTCAVQAADDSVWCWGDNTYGQLGIGTSGGSAGVSAVAVATSASVQLTLGFHHTCFASYTFGGDAYCWGDNTYGQLGDGSTTQRNSPVAVYAVEIAPNSPQWVTISAGRDHTCATESGTGNARFRLWCWGNNASGQLGIGGTMGYAAPMEVMEASGVEAGDSFTCAAGLTPGLVCWGDNTYGQIGDGTHGAHLTPYNVPVPHSLVSAGNASYAVTADSVYAIDPPGHAVWGGGAAGQLGDGTFTASVTSPEQL